MTPKLREVPNVPRHKKAVMCGHELVVAVSLMLRNQQYVKQDVLETHIKQGYIFTVDKNVTRGSQEPVFPPGIVAH